MGSWGVSKFFYGLDDLQIDNFVQGIGFKSVCRGHAKWLKNSTNTFLYINSGEFGVDRGSTKIGQIKHPDDNICAELRKWVQKANMIFVMVGYDNFHAASVNGRFRRGNAPTNLRNWEGHAGLLIIERGKDWVYYDGQLYVGVTRYKHWVWRAVSEILRRPLRNLLGLERATIVANMFADRVNIEHACAAPILFVINSKIEGEDKNTDPYENPIVLPNFLDKICTVLRGMGHSDMCGSVPWEEREVV